MERERPGSGTFKTGPSIPDPRKVQRMARFTRNYMLEIGAVVLAVGLVFTFLSYVYRFASPDWLGWWEDALAAVPGADAEGWNLLIMIIATIMLISGGFYFGEQLVLRRRFERLIDTPKKSEFVANRKDLDALARRLPTQYRARINAKEAEFRSLR